MSNREQILAGKRVLVTGGGTGIGFGISRLLLESGASVTLAARREEVLAEAVAALAAEVEGAEGRVNSVACDVTDEEQVQKAVAFAAAGGNLDVLINNAGTGLPGVLMNLGVEAWRFCSDINVHAPALCMKHAALVMKDKGGGSIVNISSVSATHYQPWLIPYNTTKAGQDMLTRSAAIELAQHGIRVNAVAPGFVPVNDLMDDVRSEYVHITPLRRVGVPEDIAEAVLFLASGRSSFVTGQCLNVDGGISLGLMLDMGPAAKLLYGEEGLAANRIEDYRSVPGK